MTIDPATFADSSAILIGVSAYEYAEFPPLRAARNSIQSMHALLSAPTLCGWPDERITVISNPISIADLAVQIADIAENTADVMLLYYVGHGVLTARGKLCLAVTSTLPNRPEISGLAWETIADVLRACPSKVRISILDCCFAGQAIEALVENDGTGLADITHVEGVYTLTATTRNHTAHVPPPNQQNAECTSFTGELRDVIRAGIPHKSSRLTLGDIYPVLRQRLLAKGLPTPNQRGTDTAYQFPFTANAAIQARDSNALAQSGPILPPQSRRDQTRRVPRSQTVRTDLGAGASGPAYANEKLLQRVGSEHTRPTDDSHSTSANTKYNVTPISNGIKVSGDGSKVLEVELPRGKYRLTWTTEGRGYFGVNHENGSSTNLINETPPEPNSGETIVRIGDSGRQLFAVKASTLTWTLIFAQL